MKKGVSPAVAIIVILVVVVIIAAIGYSVYNKKPSAGAGGEDGMVDFSKEGTDMMKGTGEDAGAAPGPATGSDGPAAGSTQ